MLSGLTGESNGFPVGGPEPGGFGLRIRTCGLKNLDHSPLPQIAFRRRFLPGLIPPRSGKGSFAASRFGREVDFVMANKTRGQPARCVV